jgi:hypothetical protein
MDLWVVCWTENNGAPGMEIFRDIEEAMRCIRFMAENKAGCIIRKISIRSEERREEQPEEITVTEAEAEE